MLQKLSKCEVKAILETMNIEFLVNLRLASYSNLQKSKFRTSKIVKINIFGLFEFPKMAISRKIGVALK